MSNEIVYWTAITVSVKARYGRNDAATVSVKTDGDLNEAKRKAIVDAVVAAVKSTPFGNQVAQLAEETRGHGLRITINL